MVNQAWPWIVGRLLGASSWRQAGFWFTLQTLPRRLNHRTVLASSLAVGLSLVVVTVGSNIVTIQADSETVPVTILAAQSLLLACVLTGFRHTTQVPSDLRASRTFSLAWIGNARAYVSGVKCAAFIALVLPLLTALFIWHAALLGLRLATLHFCTGVVFSMLLIEVLFLRYRRVPFVSAYVPSVELKSRVVLYVVTMLVVSYVLASIERFALTAAFRYILLVGVAMAIGGALAAFDRAWRSVAVELDLDEEPPLPTQRLGLSS